jgi:ABC-type lipoprotein export system ATPase subunit
MSVGELTGSLVRCRGVSVTYGDGSRRVDALREIDLAIQAGETVSLWGPSGSGKTTLLQVLGGLIVPTGGNVTWHGRPLSSLDAAARGAARAHGIAYVFQGANLLPHFTAFENVEFAAHTSGRDVAPAFRSDELLELVGLADKLEALPDELSGGERQRVALARALAQGAEMLLCDEPTGQLDSDTGGRVLELIEALWNEFGFALVVATHDPELGTHFERIVNLVEGRIAAEERQS